MARADLTVHFDRIERLVNEMDAFVPKDYKGVTEFRADLAGLLVVSIAASYESCVKETLVNYASNCHTLFGQFTANNFEKLNSKIAVSDLNRYTKLFDTGINKKFKSNLSRRKERIDKRIGRNIESSYEQILSWRHDFAHAGLRNTTIEEALITHRLAKRVLYAFDEAFSS